MQHRVTYRELRAYLPASTPALCPRAAVTPRSTGSRTLTGQPRTALWASTHAPLRASHAQRAATARSSTL
eukprot:15442809-Alexandrium_andersonii.AAC.1